jgi:phosphopantothenoylcysteine decarboxylase/phosphopantothenate--cysteine ligase
MFDLASEFSIEHVSLAKAADIVVIAPATANIIARLAAGIADDMLCCTVLATKAPVLIAPAMETNMYTNPITQDNLSKLKARNFVIVGPATGWLASGRVGLGRLAHINDIIGSIRQVLGRGGDLAGSYIVVTAGGTQEPVDPVRYLGNRSSGKMGYAMAEAARERGAKVTLITAPTSLPEPVGVDIVKVGTAREMRQAVENVTLEADALVMAAAVADYRPIKAAKDKIKKGKAGLTLELECTPDILGTVKGNFIKVGFAAESANLVENAREKLKQKKLDLIIANDITASDSGFGADTNRVTIIDRKGKIDSLPLLAKREVAERVLDRVAGLIPLTQKAERVLTEEEVKRRHIHIEKKDNNMFPPQGERFDLVLDDQTTIRTKCRWVSQGQGRMAIQEKLGEWFEAHQQELEPHVTKVVFEVIEPMKRYRLKIA